ncbi:MAG TPA: hypothetical protein VNL77_07090 [Roseiflexaceae bacterium]|nr:hypothetical protein [Roseiflexaceae bacterium]
MTAAPASSIYVRRVALALLALLSIGSAAYTAIAWSSGDATAWLGALAAAGNLVLLAAYIRGWEPARVWVVVIFSVIVGAGMATLSNARPPGQQVPLPASVLLPAVLALVLAGPRWVAGSTADRDRRPHGAHGRGTPVHRPVRGGGGGHVRRRAAAQPLPDGPRTARRRGGAGALRAARRRPA